MCQDKSYYVTDVGDLKHVKPAIAISKPKQLAMAKDPLGFNYILSSFILLEFHLSSLLFRIWETYKWICDASLRLQKL